MRLSSIFPLIVLLTGANAAGIGEAWQVTPHAKSVYTDHPFRPRLDSSAFEVRTVSGVGRLAPLDESANAPKQRPEFTTLSSVEPDALPAGEQASRESRNLEHLRESLEDSSYNDDDDDETEEEDGIEDDAVPIRKLFKTELMMRLLNLNKEDEDDDDDDDDDDDEGESPNDTRGLIQRVRRQAENETSMEKISTTKSVREARLNFPETWSTSVQPFSVEFRHRIPLDQVVQQQQEEEAALSSSYRRHQAPRADFVTSHHRRSYPESRESRDMPITRNYQDDYETPWYRNAIRERDYEFPSYRRGYSYQYPDRYRTERDYYIRPSNDPYYYDRYDRYREDDFDLYGRSRPTPKPKRIIYYATLPEIVRKPVDLRNYPRTPYDAANTAKSTGTRDSTYKRIPGNVDPSRFRYRNLYDAYDPYMKRSSYYERPYGYSDSSDTRHVKISTKENLRNDEFSAGNERKVSNLITIRDDDGKLPWPMQIGAEVSIKEDERIPGRKIFGDSASGYERFQSAQLQKAPDATGSSELQNDN
ncbi:uncharacterized protein DDB_G0283697-like [Odontomachus brunneus]|uniref:uncharacterized protein DDB_G0283697-like n=1 Tax=Odontomachus brunneus TaxID=486640 RepID=UPI0013F19007|nr:uncharacterized protein DDB_G0283697-like [Odontomachus brunneus]XP_032683533.1 uncharacterized protein DDB_G0283697-like [Odontomachus brunneus]XP_032683534.1 uncharacterized protein DDB_G0283697-like [Odontomachus brunneus]XP_032683535.1 uncharacterized protein DDB_G0283697-like [Odontomachus brunneus]XP_032683536.1 uncharacterized protein DDB_G0283697-like [Odontomachus brunneus]XP_032683537.1 uncharacterized protein DDB_G0283697-like [Odontomachus brunneus]